MYTVEDEEAGESNQAPGRKEDCGDGDFSGKIGQIDTSGAAACKDVLIGRDKRPTVTGCCVLPRGARNVLINHLINLEGNLGASLLVFGVKCERFACKQLKRVKKRHFQKKN